MAPNWACPQFPQFKKNFLKVYKIKSLPKIFLKKIPNLILNLFSPFSPNLTLNSSFSSTYYQLYSTLFSSLSFPIIQNSFLKCKFFQSAFLQKRLAAHIFMKFENNFFKLTGREFSLFFFYENATLPFSLLPS